MEVIENSNISENSNIPENSNTPVNCNISVRRWTYLLINPITMVFMIAFSMSGNILTDFILYRTCTITMEINETKCDMLYNNSTSEEVHKIKLIIQPETGYIQICKAFIESIFPTFLILFLGPWSDKHGRKFILITTYLSISLTFCMLTLMSNWQIGPWYFLIAYIPFACTGGMTALLLASTCYITDITNENERAWYLAWFDAFCNAGMLIGLISAPAILKASNYVIVFCTAGALCTLMTVCIIFIPETKHQSETYSQIFDFKYLKDIYNTCIKNRDGFDRWLIWNCIAGLVFQVIIVQGSFAIGYMFVSARFGWTVKEYNEYVALNIIITVLGTIFGIKLIPKYTGLSEPMIAVISVISALCNVMTCAFAWKSWHMYLAMFIGIFSDICRPTIRAILSKRIPVEDIGKVFSLTMAVETLIPFPAISLYTFVYNNYMPPIYPLPASFLSATFYVLIMAISIYIQIRINKHTRYSVQEQETISTINGLVN
ncbi:hypothetical protein P5V15_008577 [Pogonomyrmex californicus]